MFHATSPVGPDHDQIDLLLARVIIDRVRLSPKPRDRMRDDTVARKRGAQLVQLGFRLGLKTLQQIIGVDTPELGRTWAEIRRDDVQKVQRCSEGRGKLLCMPHGLIRGLTEVGCDENLLGNRSRHDKSATGTARQRPGSWP